MAAVFIAQDVTQRIVSFLDHVLIHHLFGWLLIQAQKWRVRLNA